MRAAERRTEPFDLSDDRFLSMEIEGARWRIYDNANLSIHLGDSCNADCQFCIAHLRYLDEGRIYQKPALSKDAYLRRLADLGPVFRAANPSVSITGGEPTLHPDLPEVLELLKGMGLRKRTMTTNGSGLLSSTGGKDTLSRLADYRLEHLNISRAHHDHARNAEIMRLGSGLDDLQLARAAARAKEAGIDVRLSCALLREGVCDLAGAEAYLRWASSLGIDKVIFRQLMDFDEARAEGGIPAYCRTQKVPLTGLWEAFDSSPEYRLLKTVRGYYYYVEIRGRGRMTVVSEQADLNRIDPCVERFESRFGLPTAFELVFHPNGNLCAGWFEDQRILSESRHG